MRIRLKKPLKWFCILPVLLISMVLFAHNERAFIPHESKPQPSNKPQPLIKPMPVGRLSKTRTGLFFNPADIIINQCGNAPITLPTAADANFNNPTILANYPYGPTWSDGSTGNSLTVTSPGIYYWQRTATNSVVNGDFESGNTGFQHAGYTDKTSPSPNTTLLQPAGTYAVGKNPTLYHNNFFASNGDHTSGNGNMLIVNGSDTPNQIVWQESITVKPGTDYVFSFWAANISQADITNNNTSILQFSLNNGATTTALGTITLSTANALGVWQYFNTIWNSGAINGTVTIALINNNTNTAGGNDFAVDDILFAEIFRQRYNITMNPIPVLSVIGEICGVPSYDLTKTIVGYDLSTYSYTFKDGSGNILSGTQITSAPVGTYTITETNLATGCTSNSQNTTVSINPVPPLSVTSPVAACASYDLKNAINGYDATTYTYTYKNGATTLGSSVVSTSGTYSVTATNNVTGCVSNPQNVNVTINPLPTFTATSPTLACGTSSYDLSTAISGTGGSYTYTYQDSGGNTLGSSTVTTSGTYSITAASAAGCTATHVVSVSFKSTPVVKVVSQVCIAAGTYDLRNAVIGYDPSTYTYIFKKGATTLAPTGPNNNYTKVGTGNYTVTATNADGCTSAPAAITVQSGTPPTFTVTSPTMACGVTSHDLSTDKSNPGGAYTYTYMDSGGNTLGSSTVTASGTYYIIANAAGCQSVSQSITITFKPAPTFTATSPTLACGVTSYDLSQAISGPGGTYTYTYQDNGGSTLPSSTVSASGTYKITATNTGTGCTSTQTVTVTFKPIPVLAVSTPVTVCGQTSYDLTQAISGYNSGANTYTFKDNGGNTVATPNAITVAGTYAITETDKSTGCISAPKTVTVTFTPLPVLTVSNPPAQCGGTYDLKSAITNYDNSGTYTYSYKNGATALGSSVVSASGNYTIVQTNNSTSCQSTGTVTVTINPIPVLTVTSPPAQCGGTYDLSSAITNYDNSGAYTYSYKKGATTFGSSVVSTSGNYTIVQTNNSTNCQSTGTVTVTINPIPVLALNGPHTACGTYDLTQTIVGGYDSATYTYTFKDPSGNVMTLASAKAITQSGTYTITAQDKSTGCTSLPQTTTVTVTPYPSKPGITAG